MPRTIALGTATVSSNVATLANVQIKHPCAWSKNSTGNDYKVVAVFTSTNNNFASGTSTDGTPSGYLNPMLKVAPEGALTIAITSTDNVQTTSTTSTAVALSTTVTQPLDGSLVSFNQLNSVAQSVSGATCSASNPTGCRVYIAFALSGGGAGCGNPTLYAPVYDSGTSGVGVATATTSLNVGCSWAVNAAVVQKPVSSDSSYLYFTPGVGAQGTLAVYTGTGPNTSGGGWVQDPSSTNSKTNFGFTIRFNKQGTNLQGNSVLVFRSTYGAACMTSTGNVNLPVDVQIKANSLANLSLLGTSKVQLTAKANINVNDSVTGATVCSFGAGSNPNFIQTVFDGGTSAADQYGINVYLSDGRLYKSLLLKAIGGGQIIIRTQ